MTTTKTKQAPSPAATSSDELLAGSIDKVVPDKKKTSGATQAAEEAALFQADKAAEEIAAPPAPSPSPKPPKKRAASVTAGVLPDHRYKAPRDGSFFLPKDSATIPSRDVLGRRYLVLMARPEGCDECTGRRVNTSRGPTVGGFGGYTAKSTGQPIIVSDGVYRVGAISASGLVEVADEATRESVFEACGGQEYLDTVIDRLGPDVFAGLPDTVKKAKKEEVAA